LNVSSEKQDELADFASAVDVTAKHLQKLRSEKAVPSTSTNPYVICCIPIRNHLYSMSGEVIETFLYASHDMPLQTVTKHRQKVGLKQPIECVSWSEHP
jgi:hypothetical protein